jgi:arsenite/tail-anchored protein-transporting ATPase
MQELLRKQLVFFGGKGGVGKTTCAAAFALNAAEQGRQTLIVSTDPAHSTADAFEIPIGPAVRQILPNLWGLEIDPEKEAEAYIEQVKANLKEVVSPAFFGEIQRQVEIAQVSPGAEEAALFDRLVTVIDEAQREYDLVVFDTAPTGHTLRLLSLPELMTAWVDGMVKRRETAHQLNQMWKTDGQESRLEDDPVYRVLAERRRKFAVARRLLLDRGTTSFVFVLIPEKLPILETRKAVDVLGKHKIPIAGLVVNRVLPEAPEGSFLLRRKEQERLYLAEIEREFRALHRQYVPMLDQDVRGVETLRTVAGYLMS